MSCPTWVQEMELRSSTRAASAERGYKPRIHCGSQTNSELIAILLPWWGLQCSKQEEKRKQRPRFLPTEVEEFQEDLRWHREWSVVIALVSFRILPFTISVAFLNSVLYSGV